MKTAIILFSVVLLTIGFSQVTRVEHADARLAPRLLNYQGYLTDTLGIPITNPSVSMTFTIYDAVSGGNQKWTETQGSVDVERGVFSVILGAVAQIPDSVFTAGTDRWLELAVAGQTLTPRTRIVSSAYAYTATYSDTALYARNAAADKDWNLLISDGADTTLQTGGKWGLVRAGYYAMYGNADSTHINLSVGGSIGLPGQTFKYCTLSGGISNRAENSYATVGGGEANVASGYRAIIGGGGWNTADGMGATIGGGYGNQASSEDATIAGGQYSGAGNYCATVGGGQYNNASGNTATIAGGGFNYAGGWYATVGGGGTNAASASYAMVGGGFQNANAGDYSAILGGYADTIFATADYSYLFGINSNLTQDSTFMVDMPHVWFGTEANGYEFPYGRGTAGQVMVTDDAGKLSWSSNEDNDWNFLISDGADTTLQMGGQWGLTRYGNSLYGNRDSTHVSMGGSSTTGTNGQDYGYCTVGGGFGNVASNELATVGGGNSNIASGNTATVGGGRCNTAGSNMAVVSGGNGNFAIGFTSTICGGQSNYASSDYTSVCGGSTNTASGYGSFIGGGLNNKAGGQFSVVSGGGNINAADSNSAIGNWSVIGGGIRNRATDAYSTVSGGFNNVASGYVGTVSGGSTNLASGYIATVGGGSENIANGKCAVIAGGSLNTASDTNSIVGGGYYNCAAGIYSSILGGYADTIFATGDYSYLFGINSNLTQDSTFMVDMPHIHFGTEATGYEFPTTDGTSGQVLVTNGAGLVGWGTNSDNDWTYLVSDGADTTLQMGGQWGLTRPGNVLFGNVDSTQVNLGVACTTGYVGNNFKYNTIAGGYCNSATNRSTVAGGQYNAARGEYATVGGGSYNTASGWTATIAGGDHNTASNDYSFVGGGQSNTASGILSTACGGRYNKARGNYSFVGGGGTASEADSNSAIGNYSTIGGGYHNIASGNAATISGGVANTSSNNCAAVGGGISNTASGHYSCVAGGNGNIASYHCACVGAGYVNTASGLYSFVGSGQSNLANGGLAAICCGDHNIASGYMAIVGAGQYNNASGNWSAIGGGDGNYTSGCLAAISGGQRNTVTDSFAFIGGGYRNYTAGKYSAILGGYADTIFATGDYSYLFGINSNLTQDSTFMVDMPHIRFGTEATGYEFPISDGTNGQVLVTDGSGKVSWGANTDNDWTINGDDMYSSVSGNVGIGTTNPQRTAHISGVMRLEPIATAPSSPAEGDIYVNSTDHHMYCYLDGAWKQLDN